VCCANIGWKRHILAAANVFSSLLARVVSHHLLFELFDFSVLGFGQSHLPGSTSAIPP
jgi:hypothetical protein